MQVGWMENAWKHVLDKTMERNVRFVGANGGGKVRAGWLGTSRWHHRTPGPPNTLGILQELIYWRPGLTFQRHRLPLPSIFAPFNGNSHVYREITSQPACLLLHTCQFAPSPERMLV